MQELIELKLIKDNKLETQLIESNTKLINSLINQISATTPYRHIEWCIKNLLVFSVKDQAALKRNFIKSVYKTKHKSLLEKLVRIEEWLCKQTFSLINKSNDLYLYKKLQNTDKDTIQSILEMSNKCILNPIPTILAYDLITNNNVINVSNINIIFKDKELTKLVFTQENTKLIKKILHNNQFSTLTLQEIILICELCSPLMTVKDLNKYIKHKIRYRCIPSITIANKYGIDININKLHEYPIHALKKIEFSEYNYLNEYNQNQLNNIIQRNKEKFNTKNGIKLLKTLKFLNTENSKLLKQYKKAHI